MKLSNKLLIGLLVIFIGLLIFQVTVSNREIAKQKKEKIEKVENTNTAPSPAN